MHLSLCENSEQISEAIQYYRQRGIREAKIIYLNGIQSQQSVDEENFKISSAKAYESDSLYRDVNETAVNLADAWYRDESLKESLIFNRINFGGIIQVRFVRDVISIVTRQLLLQHILKQEEIDQLLICHQSQSKDMAEKGSPIPSGEIAIECARRLKINYDTMESFHNKEASISKTSLVKFENLKNLFTKLLKNPRLWLNAIISFRKRNHRGIILFSLSYKFGSLIFGRLHKYRKWFLRERLDFRHGYKLAGKGAECYLPSDFKWGDVQEAETDNDLENRWADFLERAKKSNAFMCHGINLWPLLEKRFQFFYARDYFLFVRRVQAFETLIQKGHVRLVLVDEDVGPFNKTLVQVARQLWIPSLVLVHAVPGSVLKIAHSADKQAVWGEYQKHLLMKKGVPEEKLVTTGCSFLDPYVGRAKSYSQKEDRKKVMKKLGLPSGQRLIVLATQHFHSEDYPGMIHVHHTKKEIEELLHGSLKAFSNLRDCSFVIKLHPRDHREAFTRNIVDQYSFKGAIRIVRNMDSHRLIEACDLLIGTISTILLEAVALRKPVISVNCTGRDDFHPYADRGLTLPVKRSEMMEEVMRLALDDQKTRESLNQARDRELGYFIRTDNGNATDRIVALMEDMMGSRAEVGESVEAVSLKQAVGNAS